MLLYLQCLTRKNRYMPRQERTKSGTGIYHVMLRGINRQDIFEDAEDYLQMVACLRMITESPGSLKIIAPTSDVTIYSDGTASIDEGKEWVEYTNGEITNTYLGSKLPGTEEFDDDNFWEKYSSFHF